MRIKLLFLGLSILLPAGDFDELIKQAKTALTKFDQESARALLSQACQAEAPAERMAICESETGAIEEAVGHTGDAELHYRRALSTWNRLGPGYAATLVNLGSVYRTQGRTAEAESMLTQAFEVAREDGLRAVVASRLGGLYSESATPERGRPLLNQAIAMLRTNPAELAYARNLLGVLDVRTGDYKAGESNLREAVSLASETLGESHPETAAYEANLAIALYSQGQYGRAEVLLNRARYIVETRLPAGSFQMGRILEDLTDVETALGQFAQAEADGAQSLAILSRWREPDSPEIAAENVTLATLYMRERKIAEAAKILPDAVAVERRVASDRRALADGIRRLAELRALEHSWREAQALYGEAIAIYESTLGPSHPGIAPVLLEYAGVLKHCGVPRAEVKNIETRAKAIKT